MKKKKNRIRNFFKTLGPGLITGAADDDPAGIATYSQAGAQHGFQLIWLAFFTLPMMVVVQEMCARIGMVTGRGLAENIRRNHSKPLLYLFIFLLIAANTFNIGADLAAMAQGVQLLAPHFNFTLITIIFGIVSVCLQIFTTYKTYAKYLKYLTFTLVAYVITGFMVHQDWSQILYHSLVPHLKFTKEEIFLVCAIFGTSVSPYLFFWQTAQEVEEDISKGKKTVLQREGTSKSQVRNMRIDVFSGMFISNLIMFFIIIVCASTLFSHGITDIKTAADAAKALRPFAGSWAELLFAVGIIGTGLLTIPVLAGSSAYAIAETFYLKKGLYRRWHEAKQFYGVIILSVLIALAINLSGLDPFKALLYSAVANGLVAPGILIFIVLLSSNKKIMKAQVNHRYTSFCGWLITFIMTAAGVAVLVSFFM